MSKMKKFKHEDPAGIFIPAGVLIGVGLGGIFAKWGEGALIGLGVGFLLLAIVRLLK